MMAEDDGRWNQEPRGQSQEPWRIIPRSSPNQRTANLYPTGLENRHEPETPVCPLFSPHHPFVNKNIYYNVCPIPLPSFYTGYVVGR